MPANLFLDSNPPSLNMGNLDLIMMDSSSRGSGGSSGSGSDLDQPIPISHHNGGIVNGSGGLGLTSLNGGGNSSSDSRYFLWLKVEYLYLKFSFVIQFCVLHNLEIYN